MSIIQKVSGKTSPGNPSGITLSGVGAGDTLVFIASYTAGSDVLPTDSAGQTWTKGWVFTNVNAAIEVWYLLSANSGTHTLTWAPGTGCYNMWSLLEIPACSAVDVQSGANTTGSGTITTLTATSITTTNATDAVIAVLGVNDTTGVANMAITDPPSGWTSINVGNNSSADECGEFCYQETSATGSFGPTWTFAANSASATYSAALISFKFAAISGPVGTAFQTNAFQPDFVQEFAGTSGGTSVAITGNTGTGSPGSVTPAVSIALTGLTGTGSPGTVTPAVSVAITGVTGTGSVGNVSPQDADGITGNTGTGSPGTVSPVVSIALTGVTGTGSVGAPSGSGNADSCIGSAPHAIDNCIVNFMAPKIANSIKSVIRTIP